MTEPTALTQEQIDTYWKQGYLRVGKVLEDDEIALLRAEYEAEFAQAQRDNSFRNLAIADGGDSDVKLAAPRKMLQITQMCERNIHFRRLLYDARILDRVQDLMGPNIMLFHDQALYKPARHGGAVFWHQDNAYWKCRPASLVSCWLTLDDVTRENGAMQVIPGSHLTPVGHASAQESNALLEIKGIETDRAVTVDLPAGGCMLHHCQTLHYTQPNETDRVRRAFAIHFMPPGTRRGEKMLRVGFSHPLLRASM